MPFRTSSAANGAARPAPGDVTPDDLARLPAIHQLLFVLDDPAAGLPAVEKLCRELPPFGPRLVALAQRRAPQRKVGDLRSALSLLGNRGVESVLLEMLEDLTVLKADLDDAAAMTADPQRS